MTNAMATYTVNGIGFESFSEAIKASKPIRAEVFEVATGLRRWAPAPAPKTRTRHVIVNADGSKTEFGKVRR
jgi:hypothetical protein